MRSGFRHCLLSRNFWKNGVRCSMSFLLACIRPIKSTETRNSRNGMISYFWDMSHIEGTLESYGQLNLSRKRKL